MRFKCPYCGKVKRIGAFRVLFRWVLHRNLRVWCDKCFYSTYWHLKLWRRSYLRKEVVDQKPRLNKKP